MKLTQNEKDTLSSLIRGELAAIESYEKVMGHVSSDAEKSKLNKILEDHRQAADKLKVYLDYRGGSHPKDSGYWGDFAKVFTGTAQKFGRTSAYAALKEGEKHGLREYSEVLLKDIGETAKDFIRREFIPNQELHMLTLDALKSHN